MGKNHRPEGTRHLVKTAEPVATRIHTIGLSAQIDDSAKTSEVGRSQAAKVGGGRFGNCASAQHDSPAYWEHC